MSHGQELAIYVDPNTESELDIEQEAPFTDPTRDTYEELNRAYEFFNQRLFDSKLPPCMITLRARGKSLGYYHGHRFVHPDGRTTAEIALNPEAAAYMSPLQCLSILVHEQIHLYQHHLKLAPRRPYHDSWFASESKRVGLITSDTGLPGGKSTGQSMAHYIELNGLFELTAKEFLASGFHALWYDRIITMLNIPQEPSVAVPEIKDTEDVKSPKKRMTNQQVLEEMCKKDWEEGERPSILDNLGKMDIRQPAKKDTSKTKFRCTKCGSQAWAKETIQLKCGACDLKMYSAAQMVEAAKREDEKQKADHKTEALLDVDLRQLPLLPDDGSDDFIEDQQTIYLLTIDDEDEK